MNERMSKYIKESMLFVVIGILIALIVYLGMNDKIPLPWTNYKRSQENINKTKEELEKVFEDNETLFREVAIKFENLPAYSWCSEGDIPKEILDDDILRTQVYEILRELEFEVISTASNEDGKIRVVFKKESGYKYEVGICYNRHIEVSQILQYKLTDNWYFYFRLQS